MRLVGDHREALALGRRQLAHLVERAGKGLQRAHHDLLAGGERLGQLLALARALALHHRNHALGALEAHDGFLQLVVEHGAVRHHHHRVEDLAVVRVVQVGQEVRGPRDRVGLARAGRVLDQVLVARPVAAHRGDDGAGGVELVVAREDGVHELPGVVLPRHDVAAEDLQPRVARPHRFPQVVGGVALQVGWVARSAGVALVEGQEHGIEAVELRRHAHRRVAQRKVHQRALRKGQQRLDRVAARHARRSVLAVLQHGVFHRLGVVGLDLAGRHRDAVHEQPEVDAVLVVQRIAQLAHHAQAVGGVLRLQLGVHRQRGLELRRRDRPPQPQHLEALAQHVQRAVVGQRAAQALAHHLARVGAVGLLDARPGLGLRRLDPAHHVVGEQRQRAVVARRVGRVVQPAGGSEVVADLVFEGFFGVESGHRNSGTRVNGQEHRPDRDERLQRQGACRASTAWFRAPASRRPADAHRCNRCPARKAHGRR